MLFDDLLPPHLVTFLMTQFDRAASLPSQASYAVSLQKIQFDSTYIRLLQLQFSVIPEPCWFSSWLLSHTSPVSHTLTSTNVRTFALKAQTTQQQICEYCSLSSNKQINFTILCTDIQTILYWVTHVWISDLLPSIHKHLNSRYMNIIAKVSKSNSWLTNNVITWILQTDGSNLQ